MPACIGGLCDLGHNAKGDKWPSSLSHKLEVMITVAPYCEGWHCIANVGVIVVVPGVQSFLEE